MCDTLNRKICPRLFDYFVVVGSNKTSGHSKVNTPQLLRRYPIINHKDFELPTNIVYFCQPEGCIQNLPRPRSFSQQSTSNAFVFALTDKDTNRTRYGICVNFYRQIERHHNSTTNQSITVNSTTATVNQCNVNQREQQKQLQSTSQNPFLNAEPQIANNPFLDSCSTDQSEENEFDANHLHPAESPRPDSSASQLAPYSPSRPSSSSHRHRPVYVNSLTSLCLITHHPFFSSFRECLFTIKRLIERCNAKHAGQQFDRNNNECDQINQTSMKRDAIWSLISGECSIKNCEDQQIKEDLKQIETFIMRLLSAPVPIAGRTKLELELIDLAEISRLTIAYPEHTRFTLVDFPLHLPLELLGVNYCIQVLTCILLEHKVILQSSNYNALCMSVMAFVSMLYPLEYMFPVIPLLPCSLESAEQLLQAPTPYIIGIPSSFLKLREKHFVLPNDVWLVDLDANRIIKPEAADELPSLPELENTILSNQLKAALQIMSNTNRPQSNQQTYENDVDCVDLAARVAMINFFNSPNMLQNFQEHCRTIKLYPRPVVAVKINGFLQSRPKCSPFLLKFIRTQAVEYYAEYVLCPTNMAFLRVQTGVHAPHIVGDKVKWFGQTLQSLNYKVWAACDRKFLTNLLSKQTGKCYSPTQMIWNQEQDHSSDEEMSSSSSCSSLTNANDFFQSEILSSTSHLKAMPIQEMFCDQDVYSPPSILKLPSETGELIDHTEDLEPVNSINDKNSKDIYSKSDKDGHSSQYSSTSSLSSGSDVEENTELKLFDEFKDETDSYAKETKFIQDREKSDVYGKDFHRKEEINDVNKFELNQISTTASSSTASSTATIVASPASKTVIQSPPFNPVSSSILTAPDRPPKPQQRPSSRSGSSNTVRTGTPHKFHSLDSNIEQQHQKSQLQQQSIDGNKNNQQQPNKPSQRHSGSLDRTSSASAATKTGTTVVDQTNSACSSPTLSRTISITSVFSRTGSLANSMQNLGNNIANNLANQRDSVGNANQTQSITTAAQPHHPPKHQNSASSFLDRFTKEAKSYTRDALQATKKEMDDRKNVLIQQLHAFNETANLNKQVPTNQQSQSMHSSTNSSNSQAPEQTIRSNVNSTLGDKLASNLSANLDKFEFYSEINGLADKTSSVLSGFFSGKMVDRVKEKVAQQQFQSGRKGLVERSNLIKHSNQASNNVSYAPQSIQTGKKPNSKLQHNENQNFLQSIIDGVLAGDGIGWLKFNRVKNLMEDEIYRNFVVSRLNKTLNYKLGPDDHVQDVEISKLVWKGMLKLLIALHGLEHTYINNGLGGMQSTLIVLEIAHTHYWCKELGDCEQQSIITATNGSTSLIANSNLSKLTTNTNSSLASTAVTSPFASNENLFSATLQPPNSESNEQFQLSPQNISDAAFETIMEQKKQNNPTTGHLDRIESIESEVSDLSTTSSSVNTTATTTNCNASETGSLTVNPVYQNRLGQIPNHRNTYSDSELDGMNGNRGTNRGSIWSSKSSISNGMHYQPGNLMNAGLTETKRTYLFQGLIGKERSSLWNEPEFWGDMFLDAVSQERDVSVLDQGASEMIERYQTLNEAERKRLEHEEDRLITNLLHNMISFMIMLKVNPQMIRTKIRRLLGRCHIGVIYSDEINNLLQRLEELHDNDVDLKPSASCQAHRQTFTLYVVTDKDEKDINNNLKNKDSIDSTFKPTNLDQMCFMEVRDDGLILRSISGSILERWWYERLVNMTYCPKNKTLCLWRRSEGQTHLHKYRSKRSKDLYYCIKAAMDKAATRGVGALPGTELGGEFPVQDLTTGEGGLIQVCMEGVGLLFACSKFFVKLENIRKCYTQKGGIFVIEEYNPKTRAILERKYKSTMSDQICYAVLCVFSYIAAGPTDAKKKQPSPQKSLQIQQATK